MTCEKVQSELVTCWGSTEQLSVTVAEHLDGCETCRAEALMLQRTRLLLTSLPEEEAPDGFTASVLERLEQEGPARSWLESIGNLVIPVRQPQWARVATVGLVLALAVAGGAMWMGQSNQLPDAAQLATTVPVPSQTLMENAELEELLRRHQTFEVTQPLADDMGVGLVMYTSY